LIEPYKPGVHDMRAIQFGRFGSYDALEVVTVPEPVPAEGQALVRLAMAGINPLDDTTDRASCRPARSNRSPSARAVPASVSWRSQATRRCLPEPASC
jgi:hypothetical protein